MPAVVYYEVKGEENDLASKGGRECAKEDVVSVGLQDLQDMQNHMRETIGL